LGYEWAPFYELLIAARENGEGLYGLDCMPREDLRRIRSRDRHAAAKICEMRQQHANAVMIVLFGESHMAPQHLPRVLREMLPAERVITVLQNVDALYWQAISGQAAAVSIGDDVVCVFNSSPLEKYESYRLCFETWNAAADDMPDFAPAVYNLILSLARCLGFRLDSPRNGAQPKFLADSLPEVVNLSSGGAGASWEATQDGFFCEFADEGPVRLRSGQVRATLEERGCVYLPGTNTFLIREFQMAAVAQEAARFLHFACQGMRYSDQAKTIEDALAHFGSRLLCPGLESSKPQTENPGESLYQAYIKGGITKSALRRMFLARIENREEADLMFAKISKLAGL